MKRKTTPNLKGITLDGVQLDPGNLPTTCTEIRESIKEDLQVISRGVKKHIKAKYIPGTGRRGKHGPVRLLSQDEINDIEFERMLNMAKRRRSERTMRALAFLFDETYRTGKLIGTAELAEHLEIPKSSASSVMTAIIGKMGDLIEDTFDDKKILRQVRDDCPFDNARKFVEEYYKRDLRKAKKKVVTPKPKPTTEPTKARDAMKRALRFLYAKGNAEGDEGWVESPDVAEALGITPHSASGLVSRIDTRMHDLMIIENIGVGKQKKFRRRVNMEFVRFESTEQFVEEYYKRGPAFDKKVEPVVEPIVEVEPEAKPDDIDRSLKELEKEVREGVGEIAKQATEAIAKILNTVDRKIDLNLKVTGEVKFRFLFGENK